MKINFEIQILVKEALNLRKLKKKMSILNRTLILIKDIICALNYFYPFGP